MLVRIRFARLATIEFLNQLGVGKYFGQHPHKVLGLKAILDRLSQCLVTER
jgi:hypothetical protein